MVKVLFVCLGNICRSPTAEGVFKRLVIENGLKDKIMIESAGTHAYHVDEPPDTRAQQAALTRGVDLSSIRGRQVTTKDIEVFDYILAMDTENRHYLATMAPEGTAKKVQLFLDYATDTKLREVPDPYFGGGKGFELVLDIIEDASQGLLSDIEERYLN